MPTVLPSNYKSRVMAALRQLEADQAKAERKKKPEPAIEPPAEPQKKVRPAVVEKFNKAAKLVEKTQAPKKKARKK
jgi:hypothetical protein